MVFWGILHLEIVTERLKREYDLELIPTFPNVVYKALLADDNQMEICQPNQLQQIKNIKALEEPIVQMQIYTFDNFVGEITELIFAKRGFDMDMDYLSQEDNSNNRYGSRVLISLKIPLTEIIIDFDHQLKSLTEGYVSVEYDMTAYQKTTMNLLMVCINESNIIELNCLIHSSQAKKKAQELLEKLLTIIPRQQYKLKIQICLDSIKNIICSKSLSPYRKDVTAKCYGRDRTRKMKLLQKQKEGKKKLSDHQNRFQFTQEQIIKTIKSR